jgi:hypothetical protein
MPDPDLTDASETAALENRYDRDPRFRTVVDVIAESHQNGYRDDYGVWHTGPTISDAEVAERVLVALEVEDA